MSLLSLPIEIFEPFKKQIEDLLESKNLKLKKFNEEDQKLLFNAASGYYQISQYEDAALIFRSLLLTTPLNPCYWQSLASALQMQKNYAQALNAWAIVLRLSSKETLFYIRCAECFFLLGKAEEGINMLLDAKEKTQPSEKDTNDIDALLNAWQKEKSV